MVAIIPDEQTWAAADVVSSSTGPFNFSFKYFEKADLEVSIDGVVLAQSGFTVAPGAAAQYSGFSGGVVTLITAVENVRVVVARKTITQRLANLTGSQLTANAINTDLSKLAMMLAEQRRDLERSILALYGSAGSVFDAADVAALSAIATEIVQVADVDTEVIAVAARITELVAIYSNLADLVTVADAVNAGTIDNLLDGQVGNVDTMALLQALTPTADQVSHLAGRLAPGDGGGGLFRWLVGDYSADITADPFFGAYIPPLSDMTGASGVWQLQLTPGEAYNVLNFGAVADTTTITDGSITNGGTTLNSPSGPFVAGDVGKTIILRSRDPAIAPVRTTITAYTSATQVTVGAAVTFGANIVPAVYVAGLLYIDAQISSASPTLTIGRSFTGVTDAGGGDITLTGFASHSYFPREQIRISGTTDYDGTYLIDSVTSTTVTFAATYVSSQSGDATFSVNPVFSGGDVGDTIAIDGAGAAGSAHYTTISAFVDDVTITLTDNAATTVTAAEWVQGSPVVTGAIRDNTNTLISKETLIPNEFEAVAIVGGDTSGNDLFSRISRHVSSSFINLERNVTTGFGSEVSFGTDNSAIFLSAIKLAIRDCRGLFVSAQEAAYLLASGLYINFDDTSFNPNGYDGFTIFGEGLKSHIIAGLNSTDSVFHFDRSDGVRVESLHIDMSGSDHGGGSTQGSIIQFRYSASCRVSNCSLRGSTRHGVMLNNSNYCKIKSNNLYDSATDPFDVLGNFGNGVYVVDGSTHNCVQDNSIVNWGIGVSIQIITEGDRANDNRVHGNEIYNMHAYGIIAYKASEQGSGTIDGSLITENNIDTIHGGITNVAVSNKSFGAGIYLQQTRRAQVIGNTISKTNLLTDSAQLSPGGIGLANTSEGLISDNVIIDPNWHGIVVIDSNQFGEGADLTMVHGNRIVSPAKTGIYGQDSDRLSICDNAISNTSEDGIYVRNLNKVSLSSVSINGNTIINVSASSGRGLRATGLEHSQITANIFKGTALHGISITSCDFLIVSLNNVRGAFATAGERGITATSSNSNLIIAQNSVTNWLETGIRALGSAVVRDNILSGNTLDYQTADQWSPGAIESSASATPDLTYKSMFRLASSGTAITSFLGGTAGQIVVLKSEGTRTVNNGSIDLAGSVNFAMTANDTLTLVYDGTGWREIGRAVI